MDQAVKSALDKYNCKQGIAPPVSDTSTPFARILGWVAMIVIFVGAFSFCVKNEYLGADVLWDQITQLQVGEQTIGETIEVISQKISMTFASDESVQDDNERVTETALSKTLGGEMRSSEI